MVINGKKYEFNEQKLSELLDYMKINSKNVVVELNGEIVEKKNFDNLVVNYQDQLEIVTFVGGG
jgi:sulfur carrier protein